MELRNEKKLKYQYSTIFLQEPPFFRRYKTASGRRGYVRDGSSLQFLIEEMISLSAIDVAIHSRSIAHEFLDTIDHSLRKRVVVIDKNNQSLAKTHAIFAAIVDEFPLKIIEYGIAFENPDNLSEDLWGALPSLYSRLQSFVLGLENRLQIDIDLNAMRTNIDTVLRHSRNPHSRAILVTLLGILNTYTPQSIPSLQLHSTAPERLISIFNEFIQDETYRQMSDSAYCLGFPTRVQRSMTLLGRLAKKLVSKKPFKQITDITSKLISTATRFHVPDSEIASSLIKEGYLPPIISLKKAIGRAEELWKRTNPDLIPPKIMLDKIGNELLYEREEGE